MARSWKASSVEAMIRSWLRSLQQESRGLHDPRDNGAYYWNEREYQWALFGHMRNLSAGHGLGVKWNIHAEGKIERPRGFRWPGQRRADIVVIDHDQFLRWWREDIDHEPPYEAMIELKLVWSGMGSRLYSSGIRSDLKKLHSCVMHDITKSAYLILIDGLSRYGLPYYRPEHLRRLKHTRKVKLFHWPDGTVPLDDVRETQIGVY